MGTPKKRNVSACLTKAGFEFTCIGSVVVVHASGGRVLRQLASTFGECAALVINDPPYGTTANPWDEVIPFHSYWAAIDAVSAPKTPQVIFGSQPFTTTLIASNIANFRYELIWDKNRCGSPGLAKYRPMKVHENIAVFSKAGGHYYNPIKEPGEPYQRTHRHENHVLNNHGYGFSAKGKKVYEYNNDGWRYPKTIRQVSRDFSSQQQVHPTQKPVTLLKWLVQTYAPAGGLVIDPTAGSGSTGVACLELKQPCILIEKERKYYDLAVAWLSALHKGKPWNPTEYRKANLEPAK